MKRTNVAIAAVAAAAAPWMAIAVATPGSAASACQDPPQFSKTARWWKGASCGGLNFLANVNSNSLPSDFNDTFSSVEVGNGVSIAY